VQEKIPIVVYSPANMNAIDGSSVWTQTITLALAEVDNVDVSLLLSDAITTDRMLGPLLQHPAITVIDPVAAGLVAGHHLSLDQGARILAGMRLPRPQAVVVRGAQAARRLARERKLKGKLWPYLTDVPQRLAAIDNESRELVAEIVSAAPVLMCQTDELASFLESHFPIVGGKTWLFPPVIPGDVTRLILPPPTPDDLRLCYAGKFARRWNTYEMCDIPAQLAERRIRAKLTMVGDKVNQDEGWPEYVTAMTRKLESSPGVNWVGGVSRERSIELMSSAHVGLSWRAPELDDSLELSTKLLEYCAAGAPPLLNRTAMHERIFGEDYPLFVDPNTSVVDLLDSVTRHPEVYEQALTSVSGLSADYTLERASERLSGLVDAVFQEDQSSRFRPWRLRAT